MHLNSKGNLILKELNLYPLSGLFVKLQTAGLHDISSEKHLALEGKHSLKRANSLFWANHLGTHELESLIDLVSDRYRYLPCIKLMPWWNR